MNSTENGGLFDSEFKIGIDNSTILKIVIGCIMIFLSWALVKKIM